jgi:hypothetical protein
MNGAGDLRRRILDYLATRERAAETAEGVNRAWLGRPPIPRLIAEVEQALNEMVEEGVLVKHTLPGSVTVYRQPAPNGVD